MPVNAVEEQVPRPQKVVTHALFRFVPAISLIMLVVADLLTGPIGLSQAEGPQPRIVFARSAGVTDSSDRDEIYTMAADGTDVVRLTHNSVEDSFPAFSPDGRFIAFASARRGTPHIYVMNADGTAARRLTNSPNADSLPEWSPDGTWIVFTRNYVLQQQSDLFRVRSRGGALTRLTSTPEIEFAPEWSPDGNRIAYTLFDQHLNRYGIATIRPNGAHRRWVVTNPRSQHGYTDANPTWSPSGARVAFAREMPDRTMDIFSVRLDGTGLRRLTTARRDAQSPTWAEDGRLAFTLGTGIAVVRHDGSELQAITPSPAGDRPRPFTWPDWGPAAKR